MDRLTQTKKRIFAREAFTLIELLIVVAIIGILAAIAIPNMNDIRQRAKISRAKADLGSLATALEQYRIDWSAVPVTHPLEPFDLHDFASRLKVLTTPNSYISGIPYDVFPHESAFRHDDGDLSLLDPRYRPYPYFRGDFSGKGGMMEMSKTAYLLTSSGPDGILTTLMYYPPRSGHSTGKCGMCNVSLDDYAYLIFEVSNGIRSQGDLHKWSPDAAGCCEMWGSMGGM